MAKRKVEDMLEPLCPWIENEREVDLANRTAGCLFVVACMMAGLGAVGMFFWLLAV